MTLTIAEGYVEITPVHVCIKHLQQCGLEELCMVGGWGGCGQAVVRLKTQRMCAVG